MNNDSITREAANGSGSNPHYAERLLSLDAYRGAIMVSLAFGGFGLAETAQRHLKVEPNSSFWSTIAYQFEHVEWTGWGYWDLIQPSFMFMVGVSMAYSYVKREQSGESYRRMLGHALIRSLILILLGVFLSSNGNKMTNWAFMNVLTQIGLGYAFLFLLWRRGWVVQWSTIGVLLLGTWLAYIVYPGAGVDTTTGNEELGIKKEWAEKHLEGLAPAWHKNANVGNAIDRVVLNWFPREKPFEFNSGGYQTINFIPALATMIVGLVCGEFLRSQRSSRDKLLFVLGIGGLCLAVGWGLSAIGVIPLVKRIWTPSWALFSAGICCWILGGLFGFIDILKLRRWAFPLVVVGTNSMAIYLMSQMLKPWVGRTLQTHFGQSHFLVFGEIWEPFVKSTSIGLMLWFACLYLYKQRAFLKV